jgi:hypothetical protein
VTGKLLGSNLGLVVCKNKKLVAHLCIKVRGTPLHRSLWHAFASKSVACIWVKVYSTCLHQVQGPRDLHTGFDYFVEYVSLETLLDCCTHFSSAAGVKR